MLGLAVFVAVCAVAASAAEATGRAQGIKRVCISSYLPVVYCTHGAPGDLATGFSVELFRKVATVLNMTEGVDYYFDCLANWNEQLEDLLNPNGTCWTVASGLEIFQERLGLVRFAWPLASQGLRCLIYYEESQDIWFIFNAFELKVWLAMLGTAFGVGVAMWFLEEMTGALWPPDDEDDEDEGDEKGDLKTRGRELGVPLGMRSKWDVFMERIKGVHSEGLYNATWGTVGQMVSVASAAPKYMSGRLMAFSFGFLILIMLTLYTASTSAALTKERLSIMVDSVSDLRGKTIYTDNLYLDELKQVDILAIGIPWQTSDDDQKFLSALQSGEADVIILDDTWVRYWDATSCNLYAVGPRFRTRSMAWAWSLETPGSEVDVWSRAMLELQRSHGTMDELDDQFIDLPSECGVGEAAPSFQVKFAMVTGLWIIFALAVLCALIVLGIQILYNIYQSKKRRNTVTPEADGPSGPDPRVAQGEKMKADQPPGHPLASLDSARSRTSQEKMAIASSAAAAKHPEYPQGTPAQLAAAATIADAKEKEPPVSDEGRAAVASSPSDAQVASPTQSGQSLRQRLPPVKSTSPSNTGSVTSSPAALPPLEKKKLPPLPQTGDGLAAPRAESSLPSTPKLN